MRYVLFLMTAFCFCNAVEVILQPDPLAGFDSTIKQQYPALNFGSAIGLAVEGTPGIQQIFLIKFNMVPYTHGTVINAYLTLYCYNATGNGTLVANRVTSSWNENLVTWNNAPTYDSPSYSANLQPIFLWTSINVTAIAQIWLNNPNANYGLRLRTPQNGVNRAFRSSDGVYPPQRPKFVMEYQPATPVEPTSLGDIKALFGSS